MAVRQCSHHLEAHKFNIKLHFLPYLHESNQHIFYYILMYKLYMWSENYGTEHKLKRRCEDIFPPPLHLSSESVKLRENKTHWNNNKKSHPRSKTYNRLLLSLLSLKLHWLFAWLCMTLHEFLFTVLAQISPSGSWGGLFIFWVIFVGLLHPQLPTS